MIAVWIILGVLLTLFGGIAFIGAPYVPSKKRDVERALSELYALNEHDLLVDIGSGDGIVLRMAAHRGARAVGYELNPLLVLLSKILSRKYPAVETRLANFWSTPLPPETTVCYVFGDSRDISRITERIQYLATTSERSIWCISYAFELPNRTAHRSVGAHHLYEIAPLQRGKA